MPEIEFHDDAAFDDDDIDDPDTGADPDSEKTDDTDYLGAVDPGDEPVGRDHRAVAVLPAILWLAAAALSIAAPFARLYSTSISVGGLSGDSQSVDGWGRYGLNAGSLHGPRYGVVFCVAAAVFLVAVVLVFVRSVGRPVRVGVALIGTGAVASAIGFVTVQFVSVTDGLGAEASTAAGAPLAAHAHLGACVWLLTAAFACAVAGLAADVLATNGTEGDDADALPGDDPADDDVVAASG